MLPALSVYIVDAADIVGTVSCVHSIDRVHRATPVGSIHTVDTSRSAGTVSSVHSAFTEVKGI